MTATEPRVIVLGIVETKPFYMLTTVHTDPAAISSVTKKVWDPAVKKKVPVAIKRLQINCDYNMNMNAVDALDQLAKAYEIGGPHWRNAKWTAAIADDLTKRSADAGYMLYDRRCELDEDERLRALPASTAPDDSPARGVRSRAQTSNSIVSMSHMDFLEKVAGGLIILAYNEQQGIKPEERLPLSADPLAVLEAFARARTSKSTTVRLQPSNGGDTTASGAGGSSAGTGASGAGASSGQPSLGSRKRAAPLKAASTTEPIVFGPGHCLMPLPADRDGTGLGKKSNPYCVYEACPHGASNKHQKCGRGQAYVQTGRSRCQFWCPACERPYHADCCNRVHRWGDYSFQ